jgi:signal transduction histidine kinase
VPAQISSQSVSPWFEPAAPAYSLAIALIVVPVANRITVLLTRFARSPSSGFFWSSVHMVAMVTGDGMAVLTVSDTGIGMEPGDTERIFEPFVRLDVARARDTGGAGLGLAIARSIVVAHGGTLAVESQPGSGSRLTVRLPLV